MVLSVPSLGVFQGGRAFGGGQSLWHGKADHSGLSVPIPLTVRTSQVTRVTLPLPTAQPAPQGLAGG